MKWTAFLKKYKKGLKKGQKFTLADAAKAFKEHKAQLDRSAPLPQSKPAPVQDSKIEIARQAPDIFQAKQEPESQIRPEQVEQPQQQAMQNVARPMPPSSEEMYGALCDALHQTGNNLLAFFSDDRLRIDDKKIERLTKCGTMILRKYDTEGQILEYSPEAAYVLTLADVTTEALGDARRNAYLERKAREQAQASTQATPIPQKKEEQNPAGKKFAGMLGK